VKVYIKNISMHDLVIRAFLKEAEIGGLIFNEYVSLQFKMI
jgi:hypothetical protein